MQGLIFMTQFLLVGSKEYIILNWVGLVSALSVVAVIVVLKRFRPWAVSRATANLHAGVSLFGAMRHVCFLYTPPEAAENQCQFLAFMAFFTGHASLFLNMAIAANLQRIYIHESQPQRKWRWCLYLCPIALGMGLDLLPFLMHGYGREHYGTCYIDKDAPRRELLMALLIYITRIPGYIYCLVVFLVVVVKLIRTRDKEDSRTIQRLALKTSLYPLGCFLSHLGGMLSNVFFAFGLPEIEWIRIWVLIGLSTIGLVNMLVFLSDPALELIFLSQSDIETSGYQQLGPTLSRDDPNYRVIIPYRSW